MSGVILVAGALANKPLSGGEAWVRMSWALGLRRLGYEVVFVEQVAAPMDTPANRDYFREVVAAHGLAERSALVRGEGAATDGMPWDELLETASRADLLVNISGHLTLAPLFERIRRKAYVDIDPGYTQIWHASGAVPIEGHDVHFTIAENIGRPGCDLPTAGLRWLTTRQPVVLDDWPAAPPAEARRFTTIATWRTPFGRLEHDGRTFGMKLDEFRKVVELPRRTGERFELALDIHPAEKPDIELLERNGWELADAHEVARGPDGFRGYVRGSGAEFSVAQGVYVDTNSGWFSDRSVRYLATGRPVLLQETGFSERLPVGEGLLAFRTLDEAAERTRAIADGYEHHAAQARRIAEECFDSDTVLTRFLECATA